MNTGLMYRLVDNPLYEPRVHDLIAFIEPERIHSAVSPHPDCAPRENVAIMYGETAASLCEILSRKQSFNESIAAVTWTVPK